MEFKDWFKEKRKERGLTQDDVAEKLNVVRQTVSLYENGRRYPDPTSYERIAEVLGVSKSELQKALRYEVKEQANETDGKKSIITDVILSIGLLIFNMFIIKYINKQIWLDGTKVLMIRMIMCVVNPVIIYVISKRLAVLRKSSRLKNDSFRMIMRIAVPVILVISYLGYLNFAIMKSGYLEWCTALTYYAFEKYWYMGYLMIVMIMIL